MSGTRVTPAGLMSLHYIQLRPRYWPTWSGGGSAPSEVLYSGTATALQAFLLAGITYMVHSSTIHILVCIVYHVIHTTL